jgi:hypothetical protein
MSIKDFIHGKEYLVTPNREIDIFGDVSDRPFYGKFQELEDGNANFLVIHPITDTYKSFRINKLWIKQSEEIEKTMPVPRKPDELKILLTDEEFSRAISSLGYDLEDYTIGYSQIELPFTLKKTSVNITQTSTPVVTVRLGTIGVVN